MPLSPFRNTNNTNGYCWSVSSGYSWVPTGVTEIRFSNWQVFPNPASEYVVLQQDLPSANEYSVKLYSTDGKIQGSWYFKGERLVIPTGHIPEGFYILEIAGLRSDKQQVLLKIH